MLAIIMSNVQYIIYMLTIIIGKNKYCFVSDGICCTLPSPSVSFSPTPVEAYTLKISDQFSTSG